MNHLPSDRSLFRLAAAAWLLAISLTLGARDAAAAAPPKPGAKATPQAGRTRLECGPWFALSWSAPPGDCANITPSYWVRSGWRDSTGQIREVATDPVRAALASQEMPQGRAVLFFWNVYQNPDILGHPEDRCLTPEGMPTDQPGVWPEHGIQTVRRRVDAFMRAFKQAGGRVDYVVLDYEGNCRNWGKKPDWFTALQNDPRSGPLKRELGFSDFSDVPQTHNKKYLAWNDTMNRTVWNALDRAVFDVVREYFPNAVCSNYDAYVMSKKILVPDMHGHEAWYSAYAGQAMTKPLYGFYGQLAQRNLDGRQPYGLSPMGVIRWHINTMRAIRQSDPAPFQPWISHKRLKYSLLRDNDGYQELVYHIMMHSNNVILFWNPHFGGPEPYSDDEQDRLADAVIGELNSLVGRKKGKIAVRRPIPWDCPILLSGVELPGETLWRVTAFTGSGERCQPVHGAMRNRSFTITQDGWRLTLPNAHVLRQSEPLSTLGQWIKTPAGTRPEWTLPPGGPDSTERL